MPDFEQAITRPDVLPVLCFLAVLAAHVLVGAILHAVRRHDFSWHELGAFVEQDFATTRGAAIFATFVLTVASSTGGGDWQAAWAAAWAALVASCGAATLPIVRDTLTQLAELVGGPPVGSPLH